MIRIAAEEARAPAEILARYKKLLQEKPESWDPGFRSLWGFLLGPTERAIRGNTTTSLIEKVNANPDRFSGLAAIAPQSPGAAAKELQRAVKLGLKGAVVNSQRIGNSFAFVPRNARGCGVFRVGERRFSP